MAPLVKSSRVALLFFAVLATTAAYGSDVTTITVENFDSVVASAPFVMVEFYAPWCGHCKKLEPVWEKAATELKGLSIVLAKVDATVESSLGEKFEIQGFPTIKYFRNGQVEGNYDGGREVNDIVAFAKAFSRPAVVQADDAATIDKLRSENALVVVTYGNSLESIFPVVANALRTAASFVHAPSLTYSADKSAVVVVFKTFDDGEVVATPDDYSAGDKLLNFVRRESIKLFDEMGPHNYRSYLEQKLPLAWLFVRPSDDGPERTVVAGVAKKYKGRVSFVWVDAEKYAGISERLGLDGKRFPAFAVDINQAVHYAYPEGKSIVAEDIASFVDGVLDGTVAKTIRSEPTPDPQTVDGLTTVVGSTFDDLVTNSNVDVVLEFYAPWCGHCKTLAPTYAAVAKQLAGDSLRIAKIDGTANDFDTKRFNIRGFPTIFFVPAKGGEAEEYRGERDEASLVQFIQSRTGAAGGNDANENNQDEL